MKLFLKIAVASLTLSIMFLSCKMKNDGKGKNDKSFEVSGAISNSPAKMVYLEQVPAGSTAGTIVDSTPLAKDGKFKLKTANGESMVYNIRLDQNNFPLAAVINDVSEVTLNVEVSKENNQFADKYDVKGSPASQEMKDFMFNFNNDLQKIYIIGQQSDSLTHKNPADSSLQGLGVQRKEISDRIKDYSLKSLSSPKDPALFLFELGYYQSTANATAFGLEPIDIEQVAQLITDASKKFPAHTGLNDVKIRIDEQLAQMKKMGEPKWVGKEAPDFSLPDPSGKEIKLSSFRGKYLLVDFWASWCVPCRAENPNVVKAYHQFKDKNFAILGVSLDNPGGKQEWLKAVMKDNLTWTQVSDLKGWESQVVPIYDFGQVGIPYNILVDPQGMVIGERLRGAALEAKLQEVLK